LGVFIRLLVVLSRGEKELPAEVLPFWFLLLPPVTRPYDELPFEKFEELRLEC